VDALFGQNGWGRSWRDTNYDFVHYHSEMYEPMGVARGSALIEFGGVKGRRTRLKDGDVAIVPAATGHRLIESSRDFLVVGAYPPEGTYDECTDTRERVEAKRRIAKTATPKADPVKQRRTLVSLVITQEELTMAAVTTGDVVGTLFEYGQRLSLSGGNPYRAPAYIRAADALATAAVDSNRVPPPATLVFLVGCTLLIGLPATLGH
jgi:uncharacterized protein YjlB